ncbi:barstar family protein [Streptomyces sp. NPDC056627]
MRDTHDLFLEFKRKMSFPGYFGHNWPALEDCLFDMTWLPSPGGYLLLIDDWSLVLSESKDEIPVLLRILEDAGSSWSQYPEAGVPFNTLLVREDEEGDV